LTLCFRFPGDDEEERKQSGSLLLEGLNSGKAIAVTPEYWEKKRQKLLERHNAKNKVKR